MSVSRGIVLSMKKTDEFSAIAADLFSDPEFTMDIDEALVEHAMEMDDDCYIVADAISGADLLGGAIFEKERKIVLDFEEGAQVSLGYSEPNEGTMAVAIAKLQGHIAVAYAEAGHIHLEMYHDGRMYAFEFALLEASFV